MATVTYAPTRVLNGLKTLSYAGNMLAGRLAQEQGYDEALLVTPHGRVLEGPTWTFFWVAGGRLHTPPLSDGILDSITRRRLLEELEVTEAPARSTTCARPRRRSSPRSVREVMPIAVVDEIALPAAPGPRDPRGRTRPFTQRVVRELAAERTAA